MYTVNKVTQQVAMYKPKQRYRLRNAVSASRYVYYRYIYYRYICILQHRHKTLIMYILTPTDEGHANVECFGDEPEH